jgi:6-phosphogluconolactonase
MDGGHIEEIRLAATSVNPSWLCLSDSGKYLYAANEVEDPGGTVSAYRVGEDGSLELINQRPSMGKAPCHLAIDGKGAFLFAANYFSGNVAVFPLDESGGIGKARQVIQLEGSGGPNRERQEKAHAHSVLFDRSGAFASVFDLGNDRIITYRFEPETDKPLRPAGSPYSSAPGAGPRHGVFNLAGSYAYSVNELDSTVDVLRFVSEGSFEKIQTLSALPSSFQSSNQPSKEKSFCAGVRLSPGGTIPNGEFLYASNRGHDSIAVFRIQEDGKLTFIDAFPSGGRTPRDFIPDPLGDFILAANQNSDNVTVLRVDKTTGTLKETKAYPVPAPVCLIFRNQTEG